MSDDWTVVPVGELSTVVNRGRPPAYEDGATPVLNQKCIRDGFLDLEHLKYTNEDLRPVPDWARLREGDIVITSTGRGTIGRSALIDGDLGNLTCDSHVTIVRPDRTRVVPAFLAAFLGQRKDDLEALATGSTNQTELNRASIASFFVRLPPLDEQLRIADLAAAVEQAIRASVAEAAAVERLFYARLSKTIREVAVPLEPLADLADVRSGLAKGRKPMGDTVDVPFLRAANVQDGRLDLTEIHTLAVSAADAARYALEPDDVLLVEGSGSLTRLGTGWIWTGEIPNCIHQNHVFAVRVRERLEPRWLAYWILSSHARSYFRACVKTSSGLATINKKQVGALPVAVPSTDVQAKLIDSLDRLRQTHAAVELKADALRRVRTSVIAALISGAHRIPESYDRFLGENLDTIAAEAIAV